MRIKSLYIADEQSGRDIDQVERLADAEGLSFSKMGLKILHDWLEINKRYKDAKITDYETVEVLNVKNEIKVYCKECGSYDLDNAGWVIHDIGCSSSRPFYSGVKK